MSEKKKATRGPGLPQGIRDLLKKQKEKCDPTSCCRRNGKIPYSIGKLIDSSRVPTKPS